MEAEIGQASQQMRAGHASGERAPSSMSTPVISSVSVTTPSWLQSPAQDPVTLTTKSTAPISPPFAKRRLTEWGPGDAPNGIAKVVS